MSLGMIKLMKLWKIDDRFWMITFGKYEDNKNQNLVN